MKLSIIPIDATVYKNGVCIAGLSWDGSPDDVHALQWEDVAGWIEYKDGSMNKEITALPEWAYNAEAAWEVANTPAPYAPPTADINKYNAKAELNNTDWATFADVADPANSPYLANVEEFLVYRAEMRRIAVNPVAGDLIWATPPVAVWLSD